MPIVHFSPSPPKSQLATIRFPSYRHSLPLKPYNPHSFVRELPNSKTNSKENENPIPISVWFLAFLTGWGRNQPAVLLSGNGIDIEFDEDAASCCPGHPSRFEARALPLSAFVATHAAPFLAAAIRSSSLSLSRMELRPEKMWTEPTTGSSALRVAGW
ncbi:hypothetical protein ACLOJK_008615 [Asimina triloba]